MFRIILASLLLISICNAKMFQSVSQKEGEFINKENKYYCSSCAMNLPKFYKTNHIHNDKQYCSIHCLYENTTNKELQDVKVVDTKSLKFINAKEAFYVVGSKKSATMSKKSKYAFKQIEDAKAFIKKNQGKLTNFQTAYAITKNDFETDMKMIQTKREKKVYKVGKKLYETKCQKIDVNNFQTISQLKTSLKTSCKLNKDKQLQSVSVYLWDINKLNKKQRDITSLNVPHDAKCPICGMFVSKYPKWATKIEYNGKSYFFDGPKDMMKYLFKHNIKDNNEIKISVSDYFTTKEIDGKKAYFVIGSDIYGPMGKELVAFEDDHAAYNFKNEHFGKKVFRFNEMTDEILIYLK